MADEMTASIEEQQHAFAIVATSASELTEDVSILQQSIKRFTL